MTGLDGYYREPTIAGERIVFVCETDLWSVDAEGGRALRLTSHVVHARSPALSPDGAQLAFVGREEGVFEVYVQSSEGGLARRLTWQGAYCLVLGWSEDGEWIHYASHAGVMPRLGPRLWRVRASGGAPELLPYGPAARLADGPGGRVLGRNIGDPARWKRYRGGRTGELWIDREGQGAFARLLSDLKGNVADPMWIGSRLYFLSDHEGHGNLYSCDPHGAKLERHTHHEDVYARNAKSDGRRIVYQVAAELWLYDPAEGKPRKLAITTASSKPQLQRRFVSPSRYLEGVDVHPQAHSVALTVRGKPYTCGLWEGEVVQHGVRDGVRYRLTTYLPDGESFVTLADTTGEEALELYRVLPRDSAEEPPQPERLEGLDLGRPISLEAAPVGKQVALLNQRHELIHVDLETKSARVLDRCEYGRVLGFCWSPDGRWIAYGYRGSARTSHIRVVEVKSGETHDVTAPVYLDSAPCFDPKGRYLYFVSYRTFNPVYDRFYFDLGFPMGGKPYLVTLRPDVKTPFRPEPKPLHGDDDKKDGDKDGDKKSDDKKDGAEQDAGDKKSDDKKGDDKQDDESKVEKKKDKKSKDKKGKKKDKKSKDKKGKKKDKASKDEKDEQEGESKDEKKDDQPEPVEIDFEGITQRVLALPVEEGLYGKIEATEDKVFYDRWPLHFTLEEDDEDDDDDEGADGTLYTYDLKERKEEHYVGGVSDFGLSFDRKTLVYVAERRVRVVKSSAKPEGEDASRSSGWLNLSRLSVSVVPQAEWRQMYREAWRLQRDNFWTPDMSGIDWEAVYERYLPVLERVATRAEFSDLMWEVQGELGTSHAYEFGGEYPRRVPAYRPGFLGCDLVLSEGKWKIERIVRGDSWRRPNDSPLAEPGLDVREGDVLLRVEGQPVGPEHPPGERLIHRAGEEVALVLQRGEEPPRRVVVKTIESEAELRYRAWVEGNRRWVHEQSGGKVGYLHVPNMGAKGFAEFHRYYLAEFDREGLIVDVRMNGGGHVSQLLLEKLARRRVGYDVPRWGKPEPYPSDARLGPVVCLTDEHAGSDGDIFSHCFKLLGLGPLVGKRTWGGVIGIWPRHPLVDRTVTTQAEFAFWFTDVGWSVENYGTEPDLEIDCAPQDWVAGRDPQLSGGLSEVQRLIAEEKPAVPDFGPRPVLTPPRLKHR